MKMSICAVVPAGSPLDGEKTMYTVVIEGGKAPLFVDVMHVPATGLVYAMQAEDGAEVYGEEASAADNQTADKAVSFVKRLIKNEQSYKTAAKTLSDAKLRFAIWESGNIVIFGGQTLPGNIQQSLEADGYRIFGSTDDDGGLVLGKI